MGERRDAATCAKLFDFVDRILPTYYLPAKIQSPTFVTEIYIAMAPQNPPFYSHARDSDSWVGSSKELDTDSNDDSSESHLIPKHASESKQRRSWLLVTVSCSLNVVLLFMTIYLSTQMQRTGLRSSSLGHSTDFGQSPQRLCDITSIPNGLQDL